MGVFDRYQNSNIPIPTEAQQAILSQLAANQQPAVPQRAGMFGAAQMGQALAQRRAAQQAQVRDGIFNTAYNEVMLEHANDEGGVNRKEAEIEAYERAYSAAAAKGNASLAREFLDKSLAARKALDAFELEQAKVGIQQAGADNERIRLEDVLRKEVDEQLGDSETVSTELKNLEEQLSYGNRTGDIGAIFALMRIYDPKSVVRPSEFETAEESATRLAGILADPNNDDVALDAETRARLLSWLSGTRFTDMTRAQIINSARTAAASRIGSANLIITDAQRTAADRDFNIESMTSGRAHKFLDMPPIVPLSEAQMLAITQGRVPLREVLKGNLTATPDPRSNLSTAPIVNGVDLSGLSPEDQAALSGR